MSAVRIAAIADICFGLPNYSFDRLRSMPQIYIAFVALLLIFGHNKRAITIRPFSLQMQSANRLIVLDGHH